MQKLLRAFAPVAARQVFIIKTKLNIMTQKERNTEEEFGWVQARILFLSQKVGLFEEAIEYFFARGSIILCGAGNYKEWLDLILIKIFCLA